MTIAEKSTELNEAKSLMQIALDIVKDRFQQCDNIDETFKDFCVGGGKTNIYIRNVSGDVISVWDISFRYTSTGLTDSATTDEVKADFITWLGAKEFTPIPATETYTDLE